MNAGRKDRAAWRLVQRNSRNTNLNYYLILVFINPLVEHVWSGFNLLIP